MNEQRFIFEKGNFTTKIFFAIWQNFLYWHRFLGAFNKINIKRYLNLSFI